MQAVDDAALVLQRVANVLQGGRVCALLPHLSWEQSKRAMTPLLSVDIGSPITTGPTADWHGLSNNQQISVEPSREEPFVFLLIPVRLAILVTC